jgi:Zn-finger nucleic acid-binding protein
MNCPVCKSRSLISHQLETGLAALKCETCGGYWINSFQFWKWQEEHHDTRRARADIEPVAEPREAKLCTECGRILIRYRVGHSLPFSIDRCGHCGGLWFDRNEWEVLRGRNLVEEIHLIFSATTQQRFRREDSFRRSLGEQNFAAVMRIKAWLGPHEHRGEILAFLQCTEESDKAPSTRR